VRHQRAFHLLKRPDRPSLSYVWIQDRIATSGVHPYQLRFHLAPDCRPEVKEKQTVVTHRTGASLTVGIWLVDAEGTAVPLAITVEEGWVSPCYARREPASVLVAAVQAEGSCHFVTVLAPSETGTALDVERLALFKMAEDSRCAA
jgi:Heparinase II/III-like protein